GVPVSGIRVRLVTPQGDAVDALNSSTLSGPDGRYRFESVPAGRYFAVANESAIQVIVEPGRNAAAADLVVSVAMLSSAVLPQVGPAPTGTVSGQIRDSNGKITGPIRVMLARTPPEQNRVTNLGAQTNDQGYFLFERV